jgi:flagellar biosynthesis/type III secretory pathway protein FliH
LSLVPASNFLVDFGIAPTISKVAEEASEQPSKMAIEQAWAERVEEAYVRGQDEGRKAAEAEAVALLEEQRAALEQALVAARQTWCEEEAPKLAEQLMAAIGEMRDCIAGSVERVLTPFVSQSVRQEAIRQLRATIDDLIAANRGISLEVSGPEDLLDAMRSSLSNAGVAVSYIVNEASDVQIKAGGSIVETRIAEWMRSTEGQVA